ncbi:hypothetical protein KVR01_010912 [Diaporthe batatas]|uniref:uncharacterized protein n=1 Tax=Diaporthe batatas TaxID=748121 RepID=UPI001D054F07|nr:uncharacterized protein KVR01_010912 [Diaporthe batatas]KAG8159251.1 hypothetical protein KVR01_010912 [Diaporthe batatas]
MGTTWALNAGLDHGGLSGAGGELPDVRLFDQQGHKIGHAFDPGTATTEQLPHGTPNCLWIDQDGSQPATAFQVNWPDMKPLEDDNRVGKKAYDMCHSPSFHIYQHLDPAHIVIHKRNDAEAAGVYNSEQTPPRKRNKPRRSVAEAKLAFDKKYSNMLVIDDLPSHTARSLCESKSSAGPNFVNPEHGYYCDMKAKAIHPVCSGAHNPRRNNTFCFDMEQNELGKHV